MRSPFIAASLALCVAGCGGNGDADITQPPVTEPSAAETTSPPQTSPPQTRDAYGVAPTETTGATDTTVTAEEPSEEAARITISSFSFGAVPTVSVGEEVEVVNNDDFAHTWTSEDTEFDSGSIGPGGSFRHTFDESGTYPFFCAFHSEMRGSITVQG